MYRSQATSANTVELPPMRHDSRRASSSSGSPRNGGQQRPSAKQRPDKQEWAKIWFGKLAKFHRIEDPLSWQFSREHVIEFLRSEKAEGAPTWKRLKIVQSLMLYCQQNRGSRQPDLSDIRRVLYGQVQKERMFAADGPPIEEAVGRIDPSEPEAIQELRRALRVQQRALGTERAYVGRVREFMAKHGLEALGSFDQITARDVESHLTSMAVDGNVAESTQDQAFYAILFLFEHVLKRDLQEVNAIRSNKPKRLPTVMSREEVARVLDQLSGVYLTMAQILYGCGLRLSECLQLRIKDIDFEQMQIVVRQGKGKKDRLLPLPEQLVEPLKRLIRSRRVLHQKDLDEGVASVWLPHALSRKYPDAHRQFKWQYLFASGRLSADPRTGKVHRHHLHKDTFPAHLARAVERAGIQKTISSHTFRHCFATHLLLDGSDVRTVQELLGHTDVKTTMVYLHVLNRLDITVTSPLDRLGSREAQHDAEKPAGAQSSQHPSVSCSGGGTNVDQPTTGESADETASTSATRDMESGEQTATTHPPSSFPQSDPEEAAIVKTPRQSAQKGLAGRLAPLAASLRRLVSLRDLRSSSTARSCYPFPNRIFHNAWYRKLGQANGPSAPWVSFYPLLVRCGKRCEVGASRAECPLYPNG